MFPIEKPGVLNTIAREATGQSTHNNGISLNTLINENHLEKQVEKVWAKVLDFSMPSVFIAQQLLGYTFFFIALHAIYGSSIWLLVSVWGSVANWLLHFRKGQPKNQTGTREQSDPKQTNKIKPAFVLR